jgi:hypothetical protein
VPKIQGGIVTDTLRADLERHHQTKDNQPGTGTRGQWCFVCGTTWPCDAARSLAALDEAEHRLFEALRTNGELGLFTVEESARADALAAENAALVEALRVADEAIRAAEAIPTDGKTYGLRWQADDPSGQRMSDKVKWHSRDSDLTAAADAHDAKVRADMALGARLVRVGEGILERWGTRTEDGDLLTVEWGEPDEYGVYTPTFTRHGDDNLDAKVRADERERLRPLLTFVADRLVYVYHESPYTDYVLRLRALLDPEETK